MSDGYTPRDGTVAHKVLEFLAKQPAGATFTGAELEARVKVKHVSTSLRNAIEAEALVTEKRGNAYVYSLPAPPQPTDGTLTIATWSDGDVSVQGGSVGEDGSVLYTRPQLLQLLQHVTTPHIAMQGPLLATPTLALPAPVGA